MRPSLIPIAIAIAACVVSSSAWSQHPGSQVATPATALAARPAGNVATGATTARSQSAFGQAMAELTRSVRESKQAKRVDGVERADAADRRGDELPAATGAKAQEGNVVVATSDPDGF